MRPLLLLSYTKDVEVRNGRKNWHFPKVSCFFFPAATLLFVVFLFHFCIRSKGTWAAEKKGEEVAVGGCSQKYKMGSRVQPIVHIATSSGARKGDKGDEALGRMLDRQGKTRQTRTEPQDHWSTEKNSAWSHSIPFPYPSLPFSSLLFSSFSRSFSHPFIPERQNSP